MTNGQGARAMLRASRLLIVLLAWAGGSSAAFARDQPIHVASIAEARRLPLGSLVTIEGEVSTPSGAFESSFFDKGFGVEDCGAGLFVSLQTDIGVLPRTHVRVKGVLQDSYGLLILVPADLADVKVHGRGPKVIARPEATGAINEDTEGLIVEVAGTITEAPSSDLPYGYKFAVDDGSGPISIFVNLQTGIDVTTLALGQKVRVTGFSSQFDTHYEIDPRGPQDIVVRRR